MFTEQNLNELVDFRNDLTPVLSLYLNVDPTWQTTGQYKLTLRSLLKGVAEQAQPADLDAVERYFDFQYDWQGKGVALFSSQAAGFWRSYPLAVPVQNDAYVGYRPYIKPLTDVLDAYGRYGVILVDSEGARMFLFSLGELVDASDLLGKEVRRAKHGGASGVTGMRGGMAARAARRGEAVIHRNLQDVAEATSEFCSSKSCQRLVLGGTDAVVNQFRELLPRPIQERVIGTFQVDYLAPVSEIQSRSMELIERVAEEREIQRVDQLIGNWRRGSGAAVGLSDTVTAIQEHRASLLLIAAGYEASGHRCHNCRFLMLTERQECPLCGGHVERVDDLVETLTHRALEQGVEVEIVRGNQKLDEAGSIGALLRY